MLAALLKKGNADREARLLYGEVLLELGRLKRAHAEFEAVNTEEGADFDALVGLARVYERQRQLDQAISSLAAASGIRPDDPRIFRLLGLAYEKRGDYPSALSSIRQSLKLLPDQEDLIQQLSILSSPSSMERQALHQADDPWELRPHERNRSTPMRSASEPPGQPWNPVDPTRHTHRHGSRSFP
jgi:tetratricopeptide (TPR) repeat protein